MKRVLVLNHFAVPTDSAGGTRHVELFSRVDGWSYLIAVANRGATHQTPIAPTLGFAPVPTMGYEGNNWRRVGNWLSYAGSATSHFSVGHRPDVVYASSPHLFAGLSGYLLAKRWRAPFILEIRDLWPQVLVDMGQLDETSPVYRGLKYLEAFLYQQADEIVVLAEGTSNYLVEHGIPRNKIHYIPNAADPSDFDVDTDRAELRRRYGFTKRTFVYAGAHGPANGLDLLIDAASTVTETDLEVVLVGDGVEKAELVERVSTSGLTNVRFMDPVPKREIPEVLAAADVGVHVLADVPLFRYGVSPNKVFDYMAAGLPVLTNTPGGVSEFVLGADAGITVKPVGLAEGLATFGEMSAEELHRLGANGRAYMAEHQSRTQMSGRLQSLLDQTAR